MSGDWKSSGEMMKGAGKVFDAVVGDAKTATDPRSSGQEGNFAEVTQTSFGSRVKGALAGLVLGLGLIPVSVGLLFWNEGRAVQTARSLTEGAGAVRAAEAGRVDPAMEGQLVHVSGRIVVAAPLRDTDFGVQVADAVRLVRSVEMYQWREERRSETRTNLGGSQETVTTYNYTRAWSDQPVDSSRFRQAEGRYNPPMRYSARDIVAPDARLGVRRLTERQLAGFGTPQPIHLDAAAIQAPAGAQVLDGAFYLGRDPANPQIGDMRIRFAQVPAGQATIVARQAGEGFAAFQTQAGDQIFMLQPGDLPAAQMFQQAEQANSTFTWILRAVGALLMFAAFGMLLRPFTVLGSVVPLIGSIVGVGASLIAMMLTFVLAPLVIAVAWFWFRPLVSVVVLVVGLAAAFGVSRLIAKRRAAAAAPAAVAAAG